MNSLRYAGQLGKRERMAAVGLEMRWLSGDEARQREPLVSSGVRAAIYPPEASPISAPPWAPVKARSSTRLLRNPGHG
jgi:glycine/D-amino acid oxidase-like deaminating enzyme